MQDLLSKHDTFTNDVLQSIIDDYIQSVEEKPIRYYLVKYPQMQKSRWSSEYRFGKYYWRQHGEKGRETYHVLMMATEWSMSGMNYDIFLKTLFELGGGADAGLDLGDYSYSRYNEGVDKLKMSNGNYLTLVNDVYKVHNANDELLDEHTINQKDGIDIEDRVEVGLKLIKKWNKNL